MKIKLYRLVVKKLLSLDNFVYKLISFTSIKLENGSHPKHRLTKYHDFFLNNIAESDKVLDIGCGNGCLAYDLSEKCQEIVGIDIDDKNIEVANRRYKRDNLSFIHEDVTKRSFEKTFDVVILSNVLEHIEDRSNLLRNIKKIAPKFLIRVPLIDREWLVMYKKEMGLEWRLDTTHEIEYTLDIFKKELGDNGFEIKEYLIKFGEIWAVVK